MVQGEIRGARASGEFRSFFASMAADGRSHTKISIQIAIILIYCRANDFSSKQTILMLNSYGYQSVIFCQRLFQIYRCLWWNGCRLAKLFAWGVHSCFKCGTWRGWGLGSICAIDESLLRAVKNIIEAAYFVEIGFIWRGKIMVERLRGLGFLEWFYVEMMAHRICACFTYCAETRI